ncbi:MAG: tRNA (cytidine(34)-2'-O)-methyltransferase [Sphingomonas sp.]|jgi:tRNA (cytidine/uridine-2'-O-)-methyltransferase
MRLACYQPEIAGNMGALLRLAACYGVAVDVIEPCGFVWSEAKMRRAGMDYAAQVPTERHVDWAAFRAAAPARVILLTTKAQQRVHDFEFRVSDTLLLGSESSGVPADIAQSCDAAVRIPISDKVRSFNLAVAAAIALTEALRKTGGLPK